MFRFPHNVRGWLSPAEGELLWALAADKLVLELGSFQGKSTICLAQSARLVHSVDSHVGDAHIGPQCSLASFIENLTSYGVRGKVVLHIAPFHSLLHHFRESCFGMVFIDGSHDVNSVAADVEQAIRVCEVGGWIVGHDWVFPSVEKGFSFHGLTAPDRVADSIAAFRIE